MKHSELKQLIREEVQNMLSEGVMNKLFKGHERWDGKSRKKIEDFVSGYIDNLTNPEDIQRVEEKGRYKTVQYYTNKLFEFWGWNRYKNIDDFLEMAKNNFDERGIFNTW